MRPVKLTMQAFGSYGERTTIDFTKTNQNLFLITGDTGAGKSTIFDAIVYALYGEASSGENKKDGAELQSQYADLHTEPFVELAFTEAEGGEEKLYIVRREPKHIRYAKRGGGTTESGEKVDLTLPDGTEFSQNNKETNGKIEEIVGLSKGQFMQIAMIAQGEFMELLRANSDEKKVIFRKLFHTEVYQKIVDELKRRKDEQKNAIEKICTLCQTQIAHIQVPDEFEKAEETRTLVKRIRDEKKPNIVDIENCVENLKSLCDYLNAEMSEAKKNQEQCEKTRDLARDEYSKNQALMEAFRQMEDAEQRLEECKLAEEQFEAEKEMILKIQAGYEIYAVYQRYADAYKNFEELKKNLQAQDELLPELKKKAEDAKKAEDSVRERKDAILQEFSAISERVEKQLEVFTNLDLARKKEAELEGELKLCVSQTSAAKNAILEFEKKETRFRHREEELKDVPTKLNRWEDTKKVIEELEDETLTIENLQSGLDHQKNKAEKANTAYDEARHIYSEKNAEYQAQYMAFLDAQAGFIAREKLRPGCACPVCGSLDHPNPCTLSEDHQHLTREKLDELSDGVKECQELVSAKSTEAGKEKSLLVEKENNFKDLVDKLFKKIKELTEHPCDFTDLKEAKEVLSGWKMHFLGLGIPLQQQMEELRKIQEFLKDSIETKARLKHTEDECAAKELKARTDYTAKAEEVKGLSGQITFTSREEASEALRNAKARKVEAEAAFTNANITALEAGKAMEQSETLIRRYKEDYPIREQERMDRLGEYKDILMEKQVDKDSWKEVVKGHQRSEAEELKQKVERYQTKKAEAEGALRSAKETIGGQTKPDLEVLLEKKQQAEIQEKQAKIHSDEVREMYNLNERIKEDLVPRLEERKEVKEEYARIDLLHSRLAGKVTGGRMDLETFVQRYHLQRILYSANERFREMSAGQFELRMIDEEKAGSGKNRGLDLMVYSTVTGKEREVRTLSGGESFMAALSLALGMADQIQESAASINLDIMFIDEGFGSLDDHSRQQAVKVLQQMAGGSRLIGIISHVTELKQEIEDQLYVRKDEKGSHVEWQIS